MNGAESLIKTAVASGIEVCFANPGTTEMPFVAAIDSAPGLRPILGLFEGVCTGAADGYGRMAGKPALTLLHLGPGFANGIANLHNAYRAGSPIVNLIGNNPTWHLDHPAPLNTDIASLARPVSHWVAMPESAEQLAERAAEAIGVAMSPPGKIATLIVPQDCAWTDVSTSADPPGRTEPTLVDDALIREAAEVLSAGEPSLLLIGGPALNKRGLKAAARIGRKTGCGVMIETFASRIERGAGIPPLPQIPYFPERAIDVLKGFTQVVSAGTGVPVSFFGYPNIPSELLPPGCRRMVLGEASSDLATALEALADRVGAHPDDDVPGNGVPGNVEPPVPPTGKLTPDSLAQALAAVQPEGAIMALDPVTSGFSYPSHAVASPPHTTLRVTGGAIGFGLPCAVGAAVACPDRKVIAFQADGGGMYTFQSLWTMARESLDVTVLICANRKYQILRVELERAGLTELGKGATSLTDISHPTLDWVSLARGTGVPGVRVETADDLVRQLHRSIAEPGPSLIEAVLP